MPLKILFFLFFLWPVFPKAQVLGKKEVNHLFSILQKKLESKANSSRTEAVSEMFMFVLETDSAGRVKEVYLYAQTHTRDSSFSALAALTPADFSNWQGTGCRNKTVVVPVFSLAPTDEEGGHLQQLFTDFFKNGANKKAIVNEKRNTIVTKAFVYHVPTTISG